MMEKLSQKVIGALLDTLLVNITFADDKDRVPYFNKEGKRIFACMPEVEKSSASKFRNVILRRASMS